jgi:small subunit ribosomal protein S14
MARKALIEKSNGPQKFAVRHRNRCNRCGRPRAFLRKFERVRLGVRGTQCSGAPCPAAARGWSFGHGHGHAYVHGNDFLQVRAQTRIL